MGVYWHVPGFKSYAYDVRHGDSQIFLDRRSDGKLHFFIIDGYEGEGVDRLIASLKLMGANTDKAEIWLLVTHGHYDHYKGIRTILAHKTKGKYTFNVTRLYMQDPASLKVGLRDNKGSGYVKNAIDTLYAIKDEAVARGVKVIFAKNKQKVKWGDLQWQFFREQPTRVEDSDRYGDAYLNDGSLVTWFPTLKYLTGGDGPQNLGNLCKKYRLKPLFIKGTHHGNNLPRKQAIIMWNLGCRYYWDNDLSKGITDFLQTGREDAIAVGMKVLDVIGDINGYTYNGYFCVFHKGKLQFKYKCDAPACKFASPTPAIVRNILKGKYGAGDTRITRLIFAANVNPARAQTKTNAVIKIANAIIKGTKVGLSYGKDKQRITKIDAELGTGYGKLVQDYINVLLGARKSL